VNLFHHHRNRAHPFETQISISSNLFATPKYQPHWCEPSNLRFLNTHRNSQTLSVLPGPPFKRERKKNSGKDTKMEEAPAKNEKEKEQEPAKAKPFGFDGKLHQT
jgi:hypothetical protein